MAGEFNRTGPSITALFFFFADRPPSLLVFSAPISMHFGVLSTLAGHRQGVRNITPHLRMHAPTPNDPDMSLGIADTLHTLRQGARPREPAQQGRPRRPWRPHRGGHPRGADGDAPPQQRQVVRGERQRRVRAVRVPNRKPGEDGLRAGTPARV